MLYYEVDTLIDHAGSKKYLTYSHSDRLRSGLIVEVPYGPRTILAIVIQTVKKPTFVTKPINRLVSEVTVSKNWLGLIDWFRSYYPIRSQELHGLFLPAFLLKNSSQHKLIPASKISSKPRKPLNKQQAEALSVIKKATKPVLLHGDMGSGKTLVYFEAAQNILSNGKSVLLLTPEIPLSEQLYSEATAFFEGTDVVLYNSSRTETARHKIWTHLLSNAKPVVVIGTRSALFLPIKDLGLVCVDEMHETSYKQNKNPRYHAIDVASALAKAHDASIVHGSATPPIKEYLFAERKSYPIVRMVGQAASKTKNEDARLVELVDQRNRDNFTSDPYISGRLLDEIELALKDKKQSLIFHNRRGTARVILCNRCGWSLTCPRCETHLIYHHDTNDCRCHVCGTSSTLPTNCPKCQSHDLLLKSVGVKAIEQSLRSHFPMAVIARFDSDNTKSESLGSRLGELKNRDVDIIIGTQLIAKGLDLKDLKVVGITNADSSLYLPDYTSQERMFQLVMQTIGRVGRGHGDGVCIIQTYQPANPLFEHLKTADWQAFCKLEQKERALFNYPPNCFLLKLTCRRKTEAGAKKAAEGLAANLRETGTGIEVVGPSAAFFTKTLGQYQWQILVKSKDRKRLLDIARSIPANWQADLDPVGLL